MVENAVVSNGRLTIDSEHGTILNICKPGGWTSFDVVRKVRNLLGVKKVGHGGTLDPMATGVLLVCVGKATKQFDQLLRLKKTYEGIILLGQTTDTDDVEGKVIEEKPVPVLEEQEIRRALSDFEGEIEQVPPRYSALKVGGRSMYKLARKGVEFTPQARQVVVYRAEVLKWESPEIHFRITCGSGTYIRSIARDIGEKLHTGGTLKSLTRTSIGPYTIEEAMTLQDLTCDLAANGSIQNN